MLQLFLAFLVFDLNYFIVSCERVRLNELTRIRLISFILQIAKYVVSAHCCKQSCCNKQNIIFCFYWIVCNKHSYYCQNQKNNGFRCKFFHLIFWVNCEWTPIRLFLSGVFEAAAIFFFGSKINNEMPITIIVYMIEYLTMSYASTALKA